jgi:hypothetical protein
MLRYLAAHPGRLVTKTEVQQHVWTGTHVTPNVLRVCVQEIRAALGDAAAAPRYLETVGRQGYRWLGGGDLAALPPRPADLLVGRQGEVELMVGWGEQAAHGIRQLVFISGEAGVGKTTVVAMGLARLATGHGVRTARGQCVEHTGEGEPYLPFMEALGLLGHGPERDVVRAVLGQYAPLWLAQLPGLVSVPELERLQSRLYGATPARMLREIAEALEVLTADRMLVLVLEDLQWSDPSTVEALAYLAQRPAPARLLVLGTYRPVEVLLQGHPLRGIVQELYGRGQAVELRLEFLSATDVAAYVARRLGGPVAAPLTAFIHQRTDGNALFMVNIIEHLVQQGAVVRRAGQWTLREEAEAQVASLPEGLRGLLLRRIEALPPTIRQVLEAASVVGETFAVAAVAAGVQRPVEDVETVCTGLAAHRHFLDDAGWTVWPDATSGGRGIVGLTMTARSASGITGLILPGAADRGATESHVDDVLFDLRGTSFQRSLVPGYPGDTSPYVATAGKKTVKTLPFPSRLVTEIWPPCARTKRADTDKPSPVPPSFVVKNGSKIRLRCS